MLAAIAARLANTEGRPSMMGEEAALRGGGSMPKGASADSVSSSERPPVTGVLGCVASDIPPSLLAVAETVGEIGDWAGPERELGEAAHA